MLSVFAISAVVGILGMFSYKGGAQLGRSAFLVLVLYTTVTPVAALVSSGDLSSLLISREYEKIEGEYSLVAEEAFADGVRRAVCDKFSVDEECVRIMIYGFDFANMRADRIKVILSGRAVILDCKKIEKYLDGLDIGDCEVDIEIG